jgi:hypothetical protein
MTILLIFLGFLYTAETDQNQTKWGQLGHYATGEIAERHLTEKAREHVNEILGNTSMALATVWMDDIRSDPAYDHTHSWHWVTIPDGKTYEEAEQDDGGDIIWALEKLIGELQQGGLGEREEREHLKMVMHMVGDIHQPLHVGTGEDRGGNDVWVQWMGNDSNLHRVWDTDMIQSLELSYTELANELDTATPEQIEVWQQATVRDWAYESMTYRNRIYDIPENVQLGFGYRYNNRDIVYKRVLQAGIRLAGVLNEIYG